MGLWGLQFTPFLQSTQLCEGQGVAQLPPAPLLPVLGLQLRVFQETQRAFPSSSSRPKGSSGERQSIFEEKGGEGGGVGERVTKKKIVAVPGMCLGESEPSLLSHPQLCQLRRGARHRRGQVTLRTGGQLPTCSWWAGQLPASSLVGEEPAKCLSQDLGPTASVRSPAWVSVFPSVQ